jgi:hypothetical protein
VVTSLLTGRPRCRALTRTATSSPALSGPLRCDGHPWRSQTCLCRGSAPTRHQGWEYEDAVIPLEGHYTERGVRGTSGAPDSHLLAPTNGAEASPSQRVSGTSRRPPYAYRTAFNSTHLAVLLEDTMGSTPNGSAPDAHPMCPALPHFITGHIRRSQVHIN